MNGRVRILSDLHLGHRVSWIDAARQLRRLLEDVDTVVLNGDTWQELSEKFRDEGARLLADLRAMAAEMEVELILLPGNHDPSSGSRRFLELHGGAVLVMHGDAVFPETAPWSRMVGRKRREIAAIHSARPEAASDFEARLEVAAAIGEVIKAPPKVFGQGFPAQVWDAVWPPTRAAGMLRAWATMAGETAAFAEIYRPQAEVVVCGHFHRVGIWRVRGRLIVNTGAFMRPGGSRCVDWHNGWLSVRPVRFEHGEFVPGLPAGVWKIAPSGHQSR